MNFAEGIYNITRCMLSALLLALANSHPRQEDAIGPSDCDSERAWNTQRAPSPLQTAVILRTQSSLRPMV